MTIRGSVDVVTTTEVHGWAFAPGRKDPVTVQAMLNYEVVGETLANQHRPDLATAGLGDGNSGYVIKLFRAIDPLYLPFVVVKVDNGDAELPRAPLLGFAEFFTALYRGRPAAGRPRSVYGGLWTDRTDAPALLRGKVEIGQLSPETAASAAQLIHTGTALLDLRSPPAPGWAAAPEAVGALLEDPALLSLLRAAFEDNPLAVRADLSGDGAGDLAQPSTGNPAPSPAECLALVLPVGPDVVMDVVRDSHRLPEFTRNGVSRWASGAAVDKAALVAALGLLERHRLPPGMVAVVGPGTLFRVHAPAGRAARILCLPVRQMPLALAADAGRRQFVRASGVQVWL